MIRDGPHQLVDLLQLVHRHLIDVQPAGRVEDDGVEEVLLGELDGLAANLDGARGELAEDRDVDLRAEDLQLVDGGGALEVGGDEDGLAALLAEGEGELGGGGRLALALEAQSMRTVGRSLAKRMRESTGPMRATSSS